MINPCIATMHHYAKRGNQCTVSLGTALHKWAKCQKPARNGNEILGKLAVLTYACNNFTNLEYEVHSFTGKGNVESGFKKPSNHNVTN